MKKLRNIKLPTTSVAIPGLDDVFEVRGLSVPDMVSLFQQFKPAMTALYVKVVDSGGPQLDSSLNDHMLKLIIDEMPDFTAALLATANGEAGDEETQAIAHQLPGPTQLEALQAVCALTFGRMEDNGVKKFIERLTNTFNAIGKIIAETGQTTKG